MYIKLIMRDIDNIKHCRNIVWHIFECRKWSNTFAQYRNVRNCPWEAGASKLWRFAGEFALWRRPRRAPRAWWLSAITLPPTISRPGSVFVVGEDTARRNREFMASFVRCESAGAARWDPAKQGSRAISLFFSFILCFLGRRETARTGGQEHPFNMRRIRWKRKGSQSLGFLQTKSHAETNDIADNRWCRMNFHKPGCFAGNRKRLTARQKRRHTSSFPGSLNWSRLNARNNNGLRTIPFSRDYRSIFFT